ncbi:MAG: hypothetical protein MUC43_14935 [Pirellula sp.]|jgi:hypothetical protein|nr:hypothetical protein [Pirellula sp.]
MSIKLDNPVLRHPRMALLNVLSYCITYAVQPPVDPLDLNEIGPDIEEVYGVLPGHPLRHEETISKHNPSISEKSGCWLLHGVA